MMQTVQRQSGVLLLSRKHPSDTYVRQESGGGLYFDFIGRNRRLVNTPGSRQRCAILIYR